MEVNHSQAESSSSCNECLHLCADCDANRCGVSFVCLQINNSPTPLLTSVCRMAARCSLAVRDSLSTSICCLQSEFWLLRVSSFVCRASSSDSFLDNSCFSWSIYAHSKRCFVIKKKKGERKQRTVWTLFSSACCSLMKYVFGSDSPAFIIFYTSSLFMIDERNPKNRTTKQRRVCHAMSLF